MKRLVFWVQVDRRGACAARRRGKIEQQLADIEGGDALLPPLVELLHPVPRVIERVNRLLDFFLAAHK